MPQHPTISTLTIAATATTRRELEATALADHGDVLFGPHVLTLSQWIRELAAADQPAADLPLRRVAVAHALARVPLRHFAAVRNQPGTIGLFEQTIRTLKCGGIAPHQLSDFFATRGGAAEFDLLHVYERYNAIIAEWAYVDDGDLVLLACERLRRGLSFSTIRFGGFEDDDPLFSLLRAAITTGNPACVITHIPSELVANDHCVDCDVIAAPTPRQELRWIAHYCANEVAQGIAPKAIGIVDPSDPALRQLLTEELAAVGLAPPVCATRPNRLDRALRNPRRWGDAIVTQSLDQWCHQWQTTMAEIVDPRRCVDDFRSTHGEPTRGATMQTIGRCIAIADQLETVRAVAPDHAMAGAEFRAIINALLAQSAPALDDVGPRRFDFTAPPLQPVAQLLIAGCIDGARPVTPTPPPFCMGADFRDAESALLRRLIQPPETVLVEEQRQWELWQRRARNAVIATYARTGTDGRETIPSPFLAERSTHLSVQPIPCSIMSDFLSQDTERKTQDARRKTQDQIVLTDPAIRSHIGVRFRVHCFSASQLERYAESPFVFFCERVLGLRPAEETTPEVKPKDRGTVIHAIVERYVRDYRADFQSAGAQPVSTTAIAARVAAIAATVMTEHRDIFVGTHPTLIARLQATAERLCTRLLAKELTTLRALPTPLTPYLLEWTFGEGDVPPLTIDCPGDTPILLRGRIDRIDSDAELSHFAVFDYKTGHPKAPRAAISQGRHVQLPLYLLAVERLLLSRAEAIAGLLIATQNGAKRMGLAKKEYNQTHYLFSARDGSLCSAEEWATLRRTAEEQVRAVVTGIRRAEFPPAQHDCAHWCEWRTVCGKDT